MAMRTAILGILALLPFAAPAAADTFGGFSGVDRPYLLNQDRVCQPLAVTANEAKGLPSCEQSSPDAIAKLSIKAPIVQRGPKATFAATASGTTLVVTRKGSDTPLVTWRTMDPIKKIVDVYASQYEDRVAVAYIVRSLGKEVTRVVAFELVKTTGRGSLPTPGTPGSSPGSAPDATPGATPGPATTTTPVSPALTKAVTAAHKAKGRRAAAAWQAVLAEDPEHAEARYQLAAIDARARHRDEAIAALAKLAASSRADAVEWLVEARFDPAFASLRAEPKFRAAVGLDRPPRGTYERLMGFGGQWEQTGTSCETPQVDLRAVRDRSVKIRVKAACQGSTFDRGFRGTWRIEGDRVILSLPVKGQKATEKDEAPCTFEKHGDEDALHCDLGNDLEFEVLPTRR